jgi:sugar-specific transcriptional regulator TrmB
MEVLRELGFSKTEAEVYIFLAKEGTKSPKELAQVLMMTEHQIRQALKSLESKKVIISNSDSMLSVVVFEKLLSNYIKKKW